MDDDQRKHIEGLLETHQNGTLLEREFGKDMPQQIPLANPTDEPAPDTPPTTSTPVVVSGQQEEQRRIGKFDWSLLVVNFVLAIYPGWYWIGVLPSTYSNILLASIAIGILLTFSAVLSANRHRKITYESTLRNLIIKHFNDSELRDLYFDLEIDYECLPGQSKADKVRELIAYVIRRQRIGDLVRQLRNFQPDVAWPNIDQAISRWFKTVILWVVAIGLVSLSAWTYSYSSPTFNFENGAYPGWADLHCKDSHLPGGRIRWEGTNCLGESISIDAGRSLHFGTQALAFQFNLREEPFNKAQVKYEVPGLRLDEELSGWVFVPDSAPRDLLASCLVVEHNTTRPNQPEYLFFQTGYTRLMPGQWSYVRCAPSDFISVNPDIPRWVNPLLAGFEIKRANNGFYRGVAYFDDIVLR